MPSDQSTWIAAIPETEGIEQELASKLARNAIVAALPLPPFKVPSLSVSCFRCRCHLDRYPRIPYLTLRGAPKARIFLYSHCRQDRRNSPFVVEQRPCPVVTAYTCEREICRLLPLRPMGMEPRSVWNPEVSSRHGRHSQQGVLKSHCTSSLAHSNRK